MGGGGKWCDGDVPDAKVLEMRRFDATPVLVFDPNQPQPPSNDP
jgi:hypothetical protein